MIYIYGLADPKTGDIRYVGKAQDMHSRYRRHLSEQGRNHTHKNAWLKGLGAAPLLVLIDVCGEDDWQECERWHIARLRALGVRLTNATDGGEGVPNPSSEVRQKMGWSRGRHLSVEHRQKLNGNTNASGGKGVPRHTQEFKDAVAARSRGNTWNVGNQYRRGARLSDAHRLAIADSNRRRKVS